MLKIVPLTPVEILASSLLGFRQADGVQLRLLLFLLLPVQCVYVIVMKYASSLFFFFFTFGSRSNL